MIGSDSHGVAEALFLRSFTADVTLIAPDKAMRLKPEDHAQAEGGGDRLCRRADPGGGDRQGLHRRRHRRGPLHLRHHLSGARLRHPHPARRNGRRRLSARIAASRSTATSAPASPASMPRATSSSASTRSATRWAKAASRRPPSATISGEGAALREPAMRKRKRSRRGIPGRGRSGRRRRSAMPGLNGISERLPPSRSISSRSPAP